MASRVNTYSDSNSNSSLKVPFILFAIENFAICASPASSIPIANGNSRISGSSLGSYLEVTIEANRKRY